MLSSSWLGPAQFLNLVQQEQGGQGPSVSPVATIMRPEEANAQEVTVFIIALSTSSPVLGSLYLSLISVEAQDLFKSQLVW